MDLTYIKTLNEQAQALNLKRQKILGAVEQNKERCAELIKQYNASYNANITMDNISDEYNKVKVEVETAAENLRKQIEYIESGEYKNAKPADKPNNTVTAVGTNNQPVPDSIAKVEYSAPVGINVPNANTAEKTANFGGSAVGSQSTPPSVQNGTVGVSGGSTGVPVTGFGYNPNKTASASFSGASSGFGFSGFGFNPKVATATSEPDIKTSAPVTAGFGASTISSEPEVKVAAPAGFGTPVASAPTGFGVPTNANEANAQMSNILGNKFGG